MIVMFDSAYNNQFPGNIAAGAGYVDGGIGDQPNYGWLVQAYPGADHLSIALFPGDDADCLDIEPGAANPPDAAAWYERQVARGVVRPCFYASASTMEADLIPIVQASGFPRNKIRLWSAHYGLGAHICGPATCKATSIAMDGTQWTPSALGRNLDQSLLLDDFFKTSPWPLSLGDSGPDVVILQRGLNKWKLAAPLLVTDGVFGLHTYAAVEKAQVFFTRPMTGVVDETLWDDLLKNPGDPVYGPPLNLNATGGHTTVKFTWEPPSPVTGLPAASEYEVFVYNGTVSNVHTLVHRYPRVTGDVLEYQGGSLIAGRTYTGHVVAGGSGMSHVAPDVYASVVFSTG